MKKHSHVHILILPAVTFLLSRYLYLMVILNSFNWVSANSLSQRSTNSTGCVLFLALGHKKAACETAILANPGLTSWWIDYIPLWAFCSCTDFLGWECANDNNNLFWRCAKFLELNCEVFWIPLEGTGSREPQRNWRSATTWSSNLIVIEGDCPGLARGPWMASS